MKIKYLLEQWNFWLDELFSYSIIDKIILDEWYFTDNKEYLDDFEKLEKIYLGERWKKVSLPVYFRKNIELPEDFLKYSIYISIDTGGESFLFINKIPFVGLNQYHKDHKLPYRKNFDFIIEAVPKGLFGQHQYNPIFKEAYIYQKDEELYKAWLIFALIREFGLSLEGINEDLQMKIQNILENTLGKIELISSQNNFINRMQNTKFTFDLLKGLWSMPEFTRVLTPIPEELKNSIIHYSQLALQKLLELKSQYPNIGKLYTIGHSHIDYAWLWPREETIRKAQRTFSTMLNLMSIYPNFIYLQSSAQIYEDIKENNKYIFEKIKTKTKEGKWLIEGGMWVESDCQLPSGESLVRQFLYAQNFFKEEFGVKCKIAWLPDTFGFNPNLPQILKKADILYFITTKLTWNESNPFPYDLFLWKGIDGSKVVAHIFGKYGGYNGSTDLKEILGCFREFNQKNICDSMIYTYGYGDGGGGPTYEMIERLEILKNFPLIPEIKDKNPLEFLEKIDKEKLPTYYGDLYLELHRGTFTTQGRIKRLHKLAENHIIAIESLSTLLNIFENINYPSEEITKNWKKLLRNEFHDILPGSSIKEVYEETEKELEEILTLKPNLNTDYESKHILVYNPTSYQQNLKFEINLNEDKRIYYKEAILPYQRINENKLLIYSKEVNINPYSYIVLEIKEKTENLDIKTDLNITKNMMENSYVRLIINNDGTFQIIYKELNKEIFTDKGNKLIAYPDRPRYWEAWDIPLEYEKYGKEVKEVENIEIIEKGPLRGKIKITKRYKSSIIKQYYTLYAYSPKVEIINEIDWQERRTMLRTYFPINVNTPIAYYEIPYGIYWKPTHKNTSWEKAQFEIPIHRFIDLSQGDFGVSILNNGKYGHSINENIIGITLIRSPLTPDYSADLGIHEFTYAILPHKGSLSELTIKESEELNRPLYVLNINQKLDDNFLLTWDKTNIILGAIKKAEDGNGIILRLVEYLGKEENIKLYFKIPIIEAFETNLLEEIEKTVPVNNSVIELKIKPFEIKTIKIIY